MGGLPPDIDEGESHTAVTEKCTHYLFNLPDEITASFRRFGPLVVDWPHKAESKSYFPPKGYAFLLFQVNQLLISLISPFLLHIYKLPPSRL